MQPSLPPAKSAGTDNKLSKKRSSLWPPWADLPFEITANILNRLGADERLNTAQYVCKAWHTVCIDPSLWQVIDFGEYCSSDESDCSAADSESESDCSDTDSESESDCADADSDSESESDCNESESDSDSSEADSDESDSDSEQSDSSIDEIPRNMCRYAVELSKGKLEEIRIKHFATDNLLAYIAERSNKLKRLQLVSCNNLSDEGLMEAIKRFPNLEEFSSTHTLLFRSSPMSFETVETIGKSCPLLRSFALNINPPWYCLDPSDEVAYSIARSMPELRRLELRGNGLTDEGLKAILDGCPHLESLDLHRCFHVKLNGDLRKRCASQIKYLNWKP